MATPSMAYKYRHEVLPGETLSVIAKRYHIKPRKIRRLNRLRRKKHLRAGQKLKIVTSVPCRVRFKVRYRVRRGDNLSRIARRYKMKARILRRLNTKVNFRKLRAGQRLWVVREGPRPGGQGEMFQLTSAPGYIVRNTGRAWGTFLTITQLMDVLASHGRKFPRAPPVRIDDISVKSGGFLAPHKSHRRGRDVDIRYPLKVDAKQYVRATSKTLDVERSWDLIERFLKTGDLVYVFVSYRLQKALYEFARTKKKYSKQELKKFFQYPRSRRSMVGIIRHEPGHATHFHVRFRKSTSKSPNS